LAYRYRIQLPMAWRLALSGYAIIKAFSGRGREISWLIYMLAVVLVCIALLCVDKSVRPTTDLGKQAEDDRADHPNSPWILQKIFCP
jgi:hypothetical protein